MVTALQPAELESLVPMGQAFYAEAHMPGMFDPTRWVARWRELLEQDRAFIGVLRLDGKPVGCIGAERSELREADVVTWCETFWYVSPEARVGLGVPLLEWFEAEARRRGATCVAFQTMLTFPGAEHAGRTLGRFGYTPHCIIHSKRL